MDLQQRQTNELKDRVLRERVFHTEDDVLAASWRLKRVFCHTLTSPTMQRLESAFQTVLEGAKHKDVLDVGCGRGEHTLMLLSAGARVSAIDISEPYIQDLKSKVAGSEDWGARAHLHVMDAHHLKFADESFDLVVGRGILHHLDLSLALSEIKRVLRIGGTAVFIEPLADNPLLRVFRALTPGARTIDERPLSRSDLNDLDQNWEARLQFYGLLTTPFAALTSIALRPFPNNVVVRLADRLEKAVNRIDYFRAWNQYVMLQLSKR